MFVKINGDIQENLKEVNKMESKECVRVHKINFDENIVENVEKLAK